MPHATTPPTHSPTPARADAVRAPRSLSIDLDPSNPQGLAAVRAMRTACVFFLTRHLPPDTVDRLHAAMTATATELGTRIIFCPWQHEQDGDAAAVQAIAARLWAQPTAPLALIFIDRPGAPTRCPAHLAAAFSFLARDALAQQDGLESMAITEHALVAYTSLPPDAGLGAQFHPHPHLGWGAATGRHAPALPACRSVLSLARQHWACAVHAAPDELAAVTTNVSVHPVIDLPPPPLPEPTPMPTRFGFGLGSGGGSGVGGSAASASACTSISTSTSTSTSANASASASASASVDAMPGMQYLNNEAVVVFVLVPPSATRDAEANLMLQLVRRKLIEGAREWMMPTVFVPWYGASAGPGSASAVCRPVRARTHGYGHDVLGHTGDAESATASPAGTDETEAWLLVERAVRKAHARALRGGLVLAFLDAPALVEGTVRLVHTAPAQGGNIVARRRPVPRSRIAEAEAEATTETEEDDAYDDDGGDRDGCGGRGEDTQEIITTHGRIPAEDVASAVGGVRGGATDITNDLEYSGRVDYHCPSSPEPQNRQPHESSPRPFPGPNPDSNSDLDFGLQRQYTSHPRQDQHVSPVLGPVAQPPDGNVHGNLANGTAAKPHPRHL